MDSLRRARRPGLAQKDDVHGAPGRAYTGLPRPPRCIVELRGLARPRISRENEIHKDHGNEDREIPLLPL